MAAKRKDNRATPIYSVIGIKVEDYQARVQADISINAKDPRYALDLDERDPVYSYVTRLRLIGTAAYPEDRAGQRFEVTLYGDEAPSRYVFPTLKDLQERGEYGQPLYRTYRGRELPVLREPPGLGYIEKVRGEPAWTVWVNVAARVVSDMLILLGARQGLYVAIYERKMGRIRKVEGVSVQTVDPAEE